MNASVLGTRVVRTEDPRLLTEGGTYVDDVRLDRALHVTYVRSTMPHARITVDVSDARTAPGVVEVLTAVDLDLPPAKPMPFVNQVMVRPLLADGVVRFVGEPIVAIVSETRAEGVDAAEQVVVEYDPLAAVVDPERALRDDVVLFPEAGTNTATHASSDAADGPRVDIFAGCEVVTDVRMENPRMAPAPLEVRTAAAAWGEDGRLTQWSCTQMPHNTRDALARLFRIGKEQVRVIAPDVGGGFGAKMGTYPEELLVPALARRLGRPVRWTETRSENLLAMAHGRAQMQQVKIGGRRDGTIEAYELRVVQDGGAYPAVAAMLPNFTRLMASGVYGIARIRTEAVTVVTNTTPVGAFRGAGRPEAAAAIERAVDVFADELGLDPVEVRRRNFIPADAFPFTTASGATYDSGAYEAALDAALHAAGFDALRTEQQRRRAAGERKLLGIGIATYVEVTNPGGAQEYGSIEVLPDGSAVVLTGSSAHGQGHETSFAMVASEITGIPVDRIIVRHGDTDEVPRGGGTGGSRSMQVGGSAVLQASEHVVAVARERAAELLEAAVDDIVLDRAAGTFHVAGSPSTPLTWAEVAAATGEVLRAETDFKPAGPTFPFGAHVAVVEVDAETGQVTLQRLIGVDDAGTIVNPLLFEGQIHGGAASGAGLALVEVFRYDEDGNPVTSTLADYGFPSAAELPSFELEEQVTVTPNNPLGAKGIGESGTIGATPAVQNAVVDALRHLGVRHIDLPCTSERVWRAIETAGLGSL